MRRRRRATILGGRDLSPTVRSLVFELQGGALGHEPGQYIEVYVPSASGLVMKRPYSIASAPDPQRPGRFELGVTRVHEGATSRALHDLPPGAEVEIEGPRGGFTRDPAHRQAPCAFIGAGTGLAPLRAMIEAELSRPDGPEVTLLFGCRSEADVLWGDELRRWQAERPRFHFEISLSRPAPGWAGRRGHVQAHLAELFGGRATTHFYVCGLAEMVIDARAALEQEAAIEPRRIHSEEYI